MKMNLQKLFEAQKKLDDHIRKEKGLEGEDLLEKKILALQVELGELANEHRGFKFWSENQEPNVKEVIICDGCYGETVKFVGGIYYDCGECGGSGHHGTKYPLLEEYVDCLHFILSIGNELGKHDVDISCDYTEETITGTFNRTFETIGDLRHALRNELALEAGEAYEVIFELLVGLGEMLGFTWEQVEQAYFYKNEINHARQE